ncbi:MAG: hypothetical protein RR840_03520 [Clostridium sp.]
MNKYFKFGLCLVFLSPIIGNVLGGIYNSILATDTIVDELRILYNIYDQAIVLIVGCIFMAKSHSIEEYIQKNKK